MRRSRDWFGARRLVLKTRYVVERAGNRIGAILKRPPSTLALDDVRQRLELVLTAAYGRPMPVAAIEESGWSRRLRRAAPFLVRDEPTPRIDGDTIQLAARLSTRGNVARAIDRYRLLAIEQAERIARGTVAHATIADPLERDLYLLREAAAVDAAIAQSYPGMRQMLADERSRALETRPKPLWRTPAEREVERILMKTLTEAPADLALDAPANPTQSLEWARERAADIRARGGRYRGVSLAPAWGAITAPGDGAQPMLPNHTPPDAARSGMRRQPSARGTSTPSSTGASPAESDDESSRKSPKRSEHAGRSSDRDADSRSRMRDAKTGDSGAPGTSHDSSSQGQPSAASSSPSDATNPSTRDLPPPIYYDEWNADRGTYVKAGAAVRIYDTPLGDPDWLRRELATEIATARQIRHQFERLRARRTLSVRQPRGDMLDLSACVDSMIEQRMGQAPDERVYIDARPARRGIAIALVIDASGSTEQRVTESRRIIDIEKVALLLATQALDALGDRYAIYAFSGQYASDVRVRAVKDFDDSNKETLMGRVAALRPEGFTRLGAVVRHATRELVRQSAGHRLLLLLSDGRPQDLDAYQGPYGVEDSRQAILEARASGVFPFCVTIDKAASEYLPRMFGQAGHTVLQKPEHLPKALVAVVRGLIKQ